MPKLGSSKAKKKMDFRGNFLVLRECAHIFFVINLPFAAFLFIHCPAIGLEAKKNAESWLSTHKSQAENS